jgi:hypothetical protein
LDRQRSEACANYQATPQFEARAVVHVTRPLSCHLDALVARAAISPVDFLNVPAFGSRGKDCRPAAGSRIRELEEFSLPCSSTLAAATATARGGTCKHY